MKKKMIPFVLILGFLIPSVYGQDCPRIDFNYFLDFNFTPSDCTYEADGVKMQLFNIYELPGQELLCASPANSQTIFELKILRDDIPINSGNDIRINRTQGGCWPLDFKLKYNSGNEITSSGNQVEIFNFDDLESVTITEIECGIYYDGLSKTILDFSEIPSDATPPQNDSDTEFLENLLSNSDNFLRKDYHSYVVVDEVCNNDTYQGPYGCSVGEVFNFMKSQLNYQAPQPTDFPNVTASLNASLDCIIEDLPVDLPPLPFEMIRKALITSLTTNSVVPVENNAYVNLAPNDIRYITGVMTKLVGFQEMCLENIEISNDPIKVIIDEENHCITNYTLPGHILYPGKVQRCVVSEDCGQTIKIITKGIGFHYCGDNAYGAFFSCMNLDIGERSFQAVNNRLIQDFN